MESARPARRMGRPPLYRWDDILNFDGFGGQRKELRPGRDFAETTSVESFRSSLLTEARRRNLPVATRRIGTSLGVYVLPGPDAARDWDALFDGQPHWLVRPVDFDIPNFEFIREIERAAEARNLQVNIRSVDDRVGVRAILAQPEREAPQAERVQS